MMPKRMEQRRMTNDTDIPGIEYGLIREEYLLSGHRRIAYGVAAFARSRDTDGTVIIASVRDLCPDRGRMEAFVALCNRAALDPIHLPDVADDLFAT